MAITSTWTPPASLDLATGAVLTEAIWDALISDLNYLGGATGQAIARANLLTNGGFEVWQRGVGPFTTGFAADRWQLFPTTSTCSASRIASAIGSKGFSEQVVYTHVGAGDLYVLQMVEDFTQLRGKTVAVSFKIKSSVIGTVKIGFQDGISGWRWSTTNVSVAEETLTYSAAVAATATSLQIGVHVDTATCTVEINDAMLVLSGVAADYVPLHPADDLTRCQRYYELVGTAASNDVALYGYNAAGNSSYTPISWKVTKAVSPTVTKVGTWAATNCAQPSFPSPTPYGVLFGTAITALGPFISGNTGAGALVTAEANP